MNWRGRREIEEITSLRIGAGLWIPTSNSKKWCVWKAEVTCCHLIPSLVREASRELLGKSDIWSLHLREGWYPTQAWENFSRLWSSADSLWDIQEGLIALILELGQGSYIGNGLRPQRLLAQAIRIMWCTGDLGGVGEGGKLACRCLKSLLQASGPSGED